MSSTTWLLLLTILGLLTIQFPIRTNAEATTGYEGVTIAQMKEWAIQMANSGLDKGEPCDGTVSAKAFNLMEAYGDRTLEELAGLKPSLPYKAPYLDPSKKDVICAVKKGLYCSYDPKDNYEKCQVCSELPPATIDGEVCPSVVKNIQNTKEYKLQ